MPRPNAKNLRDFFPELERGDADRLARVLKDAEGRPPRVLSHDAVDAALDYANTMIEGHGVEPVRGEYQVDRYYYDIVGLYVNTGDVYNATIVFDTERERFEVTTLGDWIEKNDKRYNII